MMLKILSRWLVIPAVALGLTVMAGLCNAQVGLPQVICKGQPVPPGWVIVGETRSFSCPGAATDLNNAWLIKKLN